MTLEMVEAVMLGDRDRAESIACARMPLRWPNPELIERAFALSVDGIRADATRLWGARILIAGGGDTSGDRGDDRASVRGSDRRVVGSVVFRGAPDETGLTEIAYGVEDQSQGQGFATEAVAAALDWALEQPRSRCVQATTFAWHRASIRVLEKVGMTHVGVREHETMGEMLVYERGRAG